jgi:DNA-binding GntR family transcriptional regulator
MRSEAGQSAYDVLRGEILTLRMKPGQDLDELALVERFGVSRTPLREALIRLSEEDLVEMRPNKGARVARLNFEDVPKMIEILELHQRVTIRRAARHRTREDLASLREAAEEFEMAVQRVDTIETVYANWKFHDIIHQACGNRYLAQDASRALTRMLRVSMFLFAPATTVSEPLGRQHDAMIEALEARDVDLADRLIVEHTNEVRAFLAKYLGEARPCDEEVHLLG